MDKLDIRTLTIEDLARDPDLLARYDDPTGYLRKFGPDWVEFAVRNPHASRDDLAMLLAVRGHTVVGKLGLYAARMCLNGQSGRVYWMQGFFLDDDVKATGVGGMMLLRARSFAKALVASGGPAESTRQLFDTAGFMELGPLKRHVLFFRARPLARKLARHPTLAGVLGPVIQPFLAAQHRLRRTFADRPMRLVFEPVERFTEDLDAVLAHERRNHFPRDARTLNWVLSFVDTDAFVIRADQRLVGYCLLRKKTMVGGPRRLPEMTVGRLIDYHVVDADAAAKRDLILFCLHRFRDAGVDLLECQVRDGEMEAILKGLGLARIGGARIHFRPGPGHSVGPDDPWHLTFGEGDAILSS